MFYDRYLKLCTDKDVSPSFAATEAGISKSLVTKWKRNQTKIPSPDVLEKLSVYFNISISELLGEEDKKEQPANTGELSEEKQELHDIIDSLSTEQVRRLLQIAHAAFDQ